MTNGNKEQSKIAGEETKPLDYFEAMDSDEKKNRFEPMHEDELLSVCMEEVSRGIGGNIASENDAEISLPLDYYFGRLPGLSKSRLRDKNASRFVSQDLMDAVEATIAEIMPTFAVEQIGFYQPMDEEDEESARDESIIVNHLIMEEFDGFMMIQSAIKDALLHRNCTVKVWWDERTDVEYEDYKDLPELALVEILKPTKEDQKVEVVHQKVTKEGDDRAIDIAEQAMASQNQEAMDMVEQSGILDAAQDLYTVRIKRMTKIGRPMIKGTPPEQVIVNGDHDSPYLYESRFVAHESLQTKSDLIARGYDPETVEKLSEYNTDIDNLSRSRDPEESDYISADESTKLLRLFECFILVDYDGDGIAERRKVDMSSNILLSNEPFDSVSLIGGVTQIVPHKYRGVSMFDRMKDIQDSKTPVMRSIIDGVQISVNPRVGIVKNGANIDDFLTSRTGGTVRMKDANAIVALPNAEVPQSSYTFLEHMDSVRRDRGGGAVDVASTSQGMSGQTGFAGLDRVMTSMELDKAIIAKNIGETLVRGIFMEMHNILRKNYKGKISKKVGGQWVGTMPSEWTKRTAVSIQVGASIGERNRQAAVMRDISVNQDRLKQTGSPMYSVDKEYSAITDAIKLSGVKSPDRYFVDPKSDEGEATQKKSAEMSQQEKQKQDELQFKMAEAQRMLGEAEMIKSQAQMDKNKVQAENDALKSEIEIMKAEKSIDVKAGELKFKYDKMIEDSALKLTELKVNSKEDQSKEVKENRDETRGEVYGN